MLRKLVRRVTVLLPFVILSGNNDALNLGSQYTASFKILLALFNEKSLAQKSSSKDENISDLDLVDEEWKEKSENCSFCRFFLSSPCSNQFKLWSKCVDKAKLEEVDFVAVCSEMTGALLECTSLNEEYFNGKTSDVSPGESGEAVGSETSPPSSSSGNE